MPSPLFILAPPRSFTSVVCAMIGQHPQLYGLPEVNLFGGSTYGNNRWYRMRPRFRHGLLRACAELGLGGQTTANVEKASAWLEAYPDATSSQIYRELTEWAEGRRLVDKSPLYVIEPGALARIGQAFPDAFFLHLTRHPRSTCESMFKLRQTVEESGGLAGQFEMNPDTLWLRPHARVLEFLESIPARQKLRVRGEDLMADPAFYLAQICRWLGIRDDQYSIDAMLHPENSSFAKRGPVNAPLGNDPSFLDAPALRPYTPKQETLAGALAYDSTMHFSPALIQYANRLGYAD